MKNIFLKIIYEKCLIFFENVNSKIFYGFQKFISETEKEKKLCRGNSKIKNKFSMIVKSKISI